LPSILTLVDFRSAMTVADRLVIADGLTVFGEDQGQAAATGFPVSSCGSRAPDVAWLA
jgi:hypothetical protein